VSNVPATSPVPPPSAPPAPADQTITREAIQQFIGTLEIPESEKTRLLAMTPGSYTGQAASLARRISGGE
jgi:hypothetical protein